MRIDAMKAFKYLFALVVAAAILIPLMMMVTLSLNPDKSEVLAIMGSWRAFVPTVVAFDNYAAVWSDPFHPFGRYLANTVFIAATSIVLSVFVNSAAAFSLAWGSGPHRRWLVLLIVAVLAVPGESIVLSQLKIVSALGLIDTYAVQILPSIANAFFIFLFYQFFAKLPKDLIEAARVDGLHLFRIYWHIGLPSSKPLIVTVSTLHFLGIWNSYLWPIMVTRGEDVRPLSVGMSAYFGSNLTSWGNVMAFAVCMALPVVVFFLIVQRHFIASITGSSIKG
jgi:multiple sugar transport system permease protein